MITVDKIEKSKKHKENIEKHLNFNDVEAPKQNSKAKNSSKGGLVGFYNNNKTLVIAGGAGLLFVGGYLIWKKYKNGSLPNIDKQ